MSAQDGGHARASTAALTLGALGVVYGDIGTSPLYALRETFQANDVDVTRTNILGACSLVFWAFVFVISIKYLLLVMRADNRGEGGIMALTSLVVPRSTQGLGRWITGLGLLGLFGTALLYGDGAITPAISVLGAVEGLKVVTPAFKDWVVPIAVIILIALFAVQKRGTGTMGKVFGPIIVVWFVVLGILGLSNIVNAPEVLQSVNPMWAWRFVSENGLAGLFGLGSVFLVVTGGEALYADMGHFGRKPIQIGWFALALPGLMINYWGQGALLLGDPSKITNPFYLMGPSWSTVPLVLLAGMATVIASQALISGVFSLTMQAMQLDYLPRLSIVHTSASQSGQVYLPTVNWVLMIGCIGLVVGFGSSSNLAGAYGLAVTATMFITTIVFFEYARKTWGWSTGRALAVCTPLALIELMFLSANLSKIPDGGWFALAVATLLIVMMTTWKRGRELVAERIGRDANPISGLLAEIREHPPTRVPGTAVFMARSPDLVPPALASNLFHNHVMHDRVVLLGVQTTDEPRVADAERAEVTELGEGIERVVLRFGFMEEPDVTVALSQMAGPSNDGDREQTTYFLGRETVIVSSLPGMAPWREKLFALQLRTAATAARFFNLPADRVFEVGSHVKI